MRSIAIAAALLLAACSGDLPTETPDALFGVGNAPALVVSNLALDNPVAIFQSPQEVTATVVVGHLRGNEYARIRLSVGKITVFRDGDSCRDKGYPSGGYCVLAVGLCDVGDSWSTRALFFDAPGTYEIAIPLEAGVLCDASGPVELVAGDYYYQMGGVVLNSKNDRKYRDVQNVSVDFTLTN